MSNERKQINRRQDIEGCPDTRVLQDDELSGVNGGFIIDGGSQSLGGPDTTVWASAELLRSRSLDRN